MIRKTSPQHRRPVTDPENVERVTLRCTCGTLQEEPLDPDAMIKDALAAVTCLFCGRAGAMKRAS